jgi:hypothetical protein
MASTIQTDRRACKRSCTVTNVPVRATQWLMEGLSDADRVGNLAARVLADLHAVVFGERPVGVRSWCDGSALLVVLGLGEPNRAGDGARDAMPDLVAAAVAAQTGWRLRPGNWAREPDLDLVMFVFHLPGTLAERPRLDGGPQALRREPADHVPAWRSWTPVPERWPEVVRARADDGAALA